MTPVVAFASKAYRELVDAFDGTDLETVAFGFAGRFNGSDRWGLIIDEIELVPSDGYRERSGGHFRLHSAYVAEVGLRALAANRSVVVIHSHPGSDFPADFSPVDVRMHELLIPGLLRQLGGPVGSLVRSPGGFSGRLWRAGFDDEQRVEHIRVAGRPLLLPEIAGHHEDQQDELFERQIRAFGQPVQRSLRKIRVGVVGLGGTGSLTAEWLAHLGVRDFVLVDPDKLEPSNVSRVVGSQLTDVGVAKVAIAERMIKRICPEALVDARAEDVTLCDALKRIATCDVVLNCTDGHASRAVVNVLPSQYALVLIDMATVLQAQDGAVDGAHAQVRLVLPAGPCLRCQGVIDVDRVTIELTDPHQRRINAQFGYSPSAPTPEPSVLPLNGLAVSLALLRLLDVLEPWLPWEVRVNLNAQTLIATEHGIKPRPDCDVCQDPEVRGRGDDVPLPCRSRPA